MHKPMIIQGRTPKAIGFLPFLDLFQQRAKEAFDILEADMIAQDEAHEFTHYHGNAAEFDGFALYKDRVLLYGSAQDRGQYDETGHNSEFSVDAADLTDAGWPVWKRRVRELAASRKARREAQKVADREKQEAQDRENRRAQYEALKQEFEPGT